MSEGIGEIHAACNQLAHLGAATVYEASGREGLIDLPLTQVVPGSSVAGPARTVLCAPGDNLMVHAGVASLQPGEVLVLALAEPEPVALIGDLLATQAKVHGAAAILVCGASRDVEELAAMGLPIWTRFVSMRGATKDGVGELDVSVEVGGVTVEPGDPIVMDRDGAVVVRQARLAEVLAASHSRLDRETAKRIKLQQGAFSYDLDGLRERVEKSSGLERPR